MLQYPIPQRLSSGARWSLAVAACVCLLPFQLVARPAAQNQDLRSVAPANVAPQERAVTASSAGDEAERQDRLLSARRAEAEARRVAVAQAREALAAAAREAREAAQGNADARPVDPGVDRGVAEIAAALERLARQVAAVNDGNANERAGLELQQMLEALQEEALRLDGATREAGIQRMIEEAKQLRERGLLDLEQSLQELQSEGSRRQIAEQIAAAARAQAAEAELSAQAARFSETQEALRRQIEELREAQAELRAQQRALQEELERLRAETKK